MKKRSLFFGFCFLLATLCSAQELYQPRDVQQAYKNETRSENGLPGQKYWQNKGIYEIKIKVNPPNRRIDGEQTITYSNNSPDTLKALNFKLILNNHKPGAARLGPVPEDYLTSGIHIDSFLENGAVSEWNSENDATNKMIKLKNPLAPGDKVKLNMDWHYNASKQSGREGAIDSTTFFLAYFYPRVAVYDDYMGWDRMVFTGSQEMYNDFNDYNVEISVPKNFVVWGTGELLNPKEVLQDSYAQRLEKSKSSDSVIQIATPADLEKKQITAQNEWNTWKWEVENITDVAFAISDHYNWDAGSVVVDLKTKRRVNVQAAYDDISADFHHMVDFGKHAVEWFSTKLPGVPYPYPKSTIVRGFADMEYPMMVNDNSAKDLDFSRFVVEHEIAHTYFPFYMGTNETRFGFMDEGWATMLEHLISIADLGEEKAVKNFQNFRVRRWASSPSMEGDLPIIIPSNILSGGALGINEYGKPALGYLAMKDLLGDKVFKKALHGYMERWNGKHPIPWDFFYSFNDLTGQNLNWFWNDWFFSNNYIDIAIENTDLSTGKIQLKNIGGMPAPVDIKVTYKNGKTETLHQTPEIWKNKDTAVIRLNNAKNISEINLDGGIFMDADRSNNTWKADK